MFNKHFEKFKSAVDVFHAENATRYVWERTNEAPDPTTVLHDSLVESGELDAFFRLFLAEYYTVYDPRPEARQEEEHPFFRAAWNARLFGPSGIANETMWTREFEFVAKQTLGYEYQPRWLCGAKDPAKTLDGNK